MVRQRSKTDERLKKQITKSRHAEREEYFGEQLTRQAAKRPHAEREEYFENNGVNYQAVPQKLSI